ncbi:MAG: tetratricopeptide repeat protein [Pseudomonadota bacterium]
MQRSLQPREHRLESLIAAVIRSSVLILTILLVVHTVVGAEQPSGTETPAQTDRKTTGCLKPGLDALKGEAFDEAVKAFAACVDKQPKSGLARYWLGKAYFYQGKHAEAADALKEAVRLEPNNYRPLYMLARVYSQDDKKLSLAQEILEKVVAGNPEFNEARLALAHTFVKQGDIKKAFVQFNLIFRKERDFARYHTELGRLLSALGQNKQAKKEFERALVLTPDYDMAKRHLEELRNKPEAGESL